MRTITSQHTVGFSTWMFVSVNLVSVYAAPVPDSCLVVGSEISGFHAEGEPVLIRFPFLENAISYRGLVMDNSTTFHISHSKHGDLPNQEHRIIQQGRALWLLPSLPSDSGTYNYVLRSSTFCFTGDITVTIYKTGREDMDMMSHPVSAWPDMDLTISCPHIDHFKSLESPQWYKGFHSGALPLNSHRYNAETGGLLTIRNISAQDEGLYTCRLTVDVNNKKYNVSRTWKLEVLVPATDSPAETTTESQDDTTTTTSGVLYPYISTPVNGSITEGHLGSSLVIQCKVFVGSPSSDSTEVNWLVNSQLVEDSYLSGRVFQAKRRVLGNLISVQLVFLEVYEEDMRAELKCVAHNLLGKQEVITQIKLQDSRFAGWMTAAIASCFFLLVVSLFLYLLCGQKWQNHKDYILTRQSSSF